MAEYGVTLAVITLGVVLAFAAFSAAIRDQIVRATELLG